MAELTAGLIDVFADAPLTGNPLAVVDHADNLSEEQMRRIAREFNQAETTFILKSDRADRRLRSFTASGAEVFGAGHNALGAWLWLAEQGELGSLSTAQTFHQEIGDSVFPIVLEKLDGRVFGHMMQSPLQLGEPISDLAPLAHSLGLDLAEILAEPSVRAADTGAAHLMVRASSAGAVDKACPAAESLLAVLKAAHAEGCYLYAFNPVATGAAYARFFNPTVGLWEDAATGTAAGPLAAYLAAAGLLHGHTLTVEQGTKMGRRSVIRVQVRPTPQISGTGITVLCGRLRV